MGRRLVAIAGMLAWLLLCEWPSGHVKLEFSIADHEFVVELFGSTPEPRCLQTAQT